MDHQQLHEQVDKEHEKEAQQVADDIEAVLKRHFPDAKMIETHRQITNTSSWEYNHRRYTNFGIMAFFVFIIGALANFLLDPIIQGWIFPMDIAIGIIVSMLFIQYEKNLY